MVCTKKRILTFRDFLRLCLFTAVVVTAASCTSADDKRAMVVGKLMEAGELASMEVRLTKYVTAKKERAALFIIPMADADFVAHTEAVVKAGIDLGKLEYEDVVISGKRISLNLPPVQMVNFSYPSEKFKVITRTEFFFQNISLKEIDDFYRQAELDIRESINYLGLEEDCKEKTTVLLKGFLKQMGFEEIYIKYKEYDRQPEPAAENKQ